MTTWDSFVTWLSSPLAVAIWGSWIRGALIFSSGVLVQHHIVTAGESEQLSTLIFAQAINALPAIAGLGLSMWQKYAARRKLVTVLSIAKLPEAAVDQHIASGAVTPPVTSPKSAVPTVGKENI